jgi:hypothetical protein
MEQVRIILVSLLPVLWLTGSEFGASSAPRSCPDASGETWCSVCAGASKGSAPDVLVSHPSSRNLGRRLTNHSGSDGFNPALAGFAFQPPGSSRAESLVAERNEPDLASSWQFYLRFVAEPRAPSVS